MTDSWTAILQELGTGGDGHLAPVSDEARHVADGGVAAPLPGTGVIRVTGEDAPAFLQAQLTNAIEDMDPGQSRLAGWCTAKGRVLALFRVIRTDEGFLLLTAAERVPAVLKRLRMFVLRARVTLEDIGGETAVIGLAGTPASAPLSELAGTPPGAVDAVTRAGDLTAVRLPDPEPRWLLLVPADEAGAVWDAIARALPAVGPSTWRLLDIRAGLPEIVDATAERFVPQMLNLEPLRGLAYDKGCYPGQEVVARMHYLGQLKRRLYRLGGAGRPPEPGATVTDADGGTLGEIVSASASGEAVFEGLAVLRIDAAANATPHIGGGPVALLDLPYAAPGTPPADAG
ncbi:folate-binding protein YgfZ [Arhodomonas sp. KWT2]|uniref:CAF17-like 4Fe-4S cluster assembly/insertion protein YgfZ n=1 Tax=Arhodomonas sp. KWT2 TaxID=3344194 RepID=UPI0035C0D79B